jgi:ferritin-like metal-binding protein YciE
MAIETLQDVLQEELRDLLSAEKQLLRALPKMAKKASSPELTKAFEEHLAQTQEHVARLEKAFEMLGRKPRSKACKAMQGLIEEGQEMMEEEASPEAMDAMIIAGAQKIEHYEIASYGTVCTWAKTLGLNDLKDLLGQTLDEEKVTDENLTELALSANSEAATEE